MLLAAGAYFKPRTAAAQPLMSMSPTEVVSSHAARNVDEDGIFFITDTDPAMESAIRDLEAANPTDRPGEWGDAGKAAKVAGLWEACYAPHMFKLSTPFGVRFGPVQYRLGTDGSARTILSNVQYRSKLFGSGWLNAAGTFASIDEGTVRIDFDRFWWDASARATPSADPGADAGGFVQALGKAGFVPGFSRFPVSPPPPPPRTEWTRRVPHPVLIGHAASLSQVRYVSDSLCVFEFELTGTNIVAVKKA